MWVNVLARGVIFGCFSSTFHRIFFFFCRVFPLNFHRSIFFTLTVLLSFVSHVHHPRSCYLDDEFSGEISMTTMMKAFFLLNLCWRSMKKSNEMINKLLDDAIYQSINFTFSTRTENRRWNNSRLCIRFQVWLIYQRNVDNRNKPFISFASRELPINFHKLSINSNQSPLII